MNKPERHALQGSKIPFPARLIANLMHYVERHTVNLSFAQLLAEAKELYDADYRDPKYLAELELNDAKHDLSVALAATDSGFIKLCRENLTALKRKQRAR
jgi:hypothetical protein